MADISKITLPSGSTYTIKDEVARAAASAGLQIVVVKAGETWPDPSASTMGKLYLRAETGQESGTYVEYVTVDNGASATPRYVWEKIGTTATDLAEYAKKGDGVTVTLNNNVSGTAVSAHSVTDNGHTHSVTGSFSGTGSVASKNVSFSTSSVTASKVKTAGSVSAGTATTPAVIDTTKFSGGSLSAGSFNGGSGSFTQGAFSQGTLPNLTTSVSNETLVIGWDAGTLPTHGADSHTHTAATHTQGTLTPAAFQTGFYTAGSKGTPTSVTLPTFDTVSNLVDTSNTASVPSQSINVSGDIEGTAANSKTGVTVANHTVTQGKVTGNASGTINS